MRVSLGGLLCVGGLAAAMVVAPPARVGRVVAQEHGGGHAEGGATDPGALFARQCASCHVTPDPAVETDRAYVRQLTETA